MFPLDVLANGGFAQDRRRVPIVGILCKKYCQVCRIIEPSLNIPGDCTYCLSQLTKHADLFGFSQTFEIILTLEGITPETGNTIQVDPLN